MKIKIEFNLPKWVDTCVATIKYAKNSVLYIIKGPRCTYCNKKLIGHMWETTSKSPNRLTTTNFHKDNLVCNDCVAEEVLTGKYDPKWFNKYDVKAKCDCCGEKQESFKVLETEKVKIHSAMGWWNGFFICRTCLYRNLKEGIISTSHNTVDREGKWVSINNYGLHLKNGKVELFKIVRY